MVRVLLGVVAILGLVGCGDSRPQRADSDRLFDAARSGDVVAIRTLVADGAQVDVRNATGQTPLIVAAEADQTAAARTLLELGADAKAADAEGETAYPFAALNNNPELIGLLLDRGADRIGTKRFGGTPLIAASDRGFVEVVRTILARPGIPVDHINDLGWTALLEAVILGDGGPAHTEIVGLLIDAGADVSIADREGVPPLEHARRRGYREMIRLLEAAGGR